MVAKKVVEEGRRRDAKNRCLKSYSDLRSRSAALGTRSLRQRVTDLEG